MPKGCRPCCRRIEPAGWRGADSRLRLSAVPWPRGVGRLSGACPQCPPRCGIGKIVQGHLPASADRGQSAFASIERQGCSRCADSCARYSAPRSSACTQRWSRLPPKAKSSACSSAGRPPTGNAAARPWKGSMRRAWTTMAARRRASAPLSAKQAFFARHPDFEQRIVAAPQIVPGDQEGRYEVRFVKQVRLDGRLRNYPGCSWPSAPGRAIPGASSARATRSPATPSTRGTPCWLAAASPVPRRTSPG